jgi:hypothetical protein
VERVRFVPTNRWFFAVLLIPLRIFRARLFVNGGGWNTNPGIFLFHQWSLLSNTFCYSFQHRLLSSPELIVNEDSQNTFALIAIVKENK